MIGLRSIQTGQWLVAITKHDEAGRVAGAVLAVDPLGVMRFETEDAALAYIKVQQAAEFFEPARLPMCGGWN